MQITKVLTQFFFFFFVNLNLNGIIQLHQTNIAQQLLIPPSSVTVCVYVCVWCVYKVARRSYFSSASCFDYRQHLWMCWLSNCFLTTFVWWCFTVLVSSYQVCFIQTIWIVYWDVYTWILFVKKKTGQSRSVLI